MSIPIPADPAPKGYVPNPYESDISRALSLTRNATSSTDGWVSVGDRDGVILEKKYTDDGSLPIARGRGVIEGYSPEDLFQVINLPACRKRWDERFEDGAALERYSQSAFKFYSTQKGSWPVSPRDIVGVSASFWNDDRSVLEIIQTTVPDTDKTPPVSGKVRASLDFAGWTFRKNGSNTEAAYVLHIDLGGSVPNWIVERVLIEAPLCVARVRDFRSTMGAPPAILPLSTTQVCFESFNLDRKEWMGNFYAKGGETFSIRVDEQKMFEGDKWIGILRGEAMDQVQLLKETGDLKVTVGEGATDRKFEVVIGST